MKLYFVYILQCNDDSYYVGITSNLEQRLQEHNSGKYPESFTFKRRPVELKWYEQFTNPDVALDWEKKIKGWSRRKKEALIREDWDRLVELSKNYTQFGKAEKN